jgi:CheY-like chemotaxis protein
MSTAPDNLTIEGIMSLTPDVPGFLYVEDDGLNRQIVELLLRRVCSYQQVTIFEDSENFMERLKALPYVPAVILLDIHVPPLDGFALLKLIRTDEAFAASRIIALTASVTVSEVNHLREFGFDGLIGKPIKQALFSSQMKDILAGTPVWYVP